MGSRPEDLMGKVEEEDFLCDVTRRGLVHRILKVSENICLHLQGGILSRGKENGQKRENKVKVTHLIKHYTK
jgi:hypothetical protein